MKKEYKILISVLVLFFISAIPASLILYEFLYDSFVSSKYEISPMIFDEDTPSDNNDIETLYNYNDATSCKNEACSPYIEIKDITVKHLFTNHNGNTIQTKPYGDFVSQLSDSSHTYYERIYHFGQAEISIKEDLEKPKDANLWFNQKSLNTIPVAVNRNNLLNGRYQNIGLVKNTDKRLKKDELLLIENTDVHSWNIYTISEKGDITKSAFSLQKLRKEPHLVKAVNRSGALGDPIGYRTGLTDVYPSLLYPVIFPFGSLIASILIVIYTIPLIRRESKH